MPRGGKQSAPAAQKAAAQRGRGRLRTPRWLIPTIKTPLEHLLIDVEQSA